ncbi:Activity-regulated cytoskeleton associated protein 1 [Frankliniella fusca]|uniref:Activity-regulated cytoskeleton associated protein 1 n=1 Tax=Frankliniella fusca TaxID=407009 RepID=A0AAE1H3Y1_9NEOP|nr:Activity-regulated cytoskeleton associated protein 1 [Frankliniella fusca]
MNFYKRLRSDELRHEVGVRGRKQPEGATVEAMRVALTELLAEEANGVEHQDALLPIDEEEELTILEAKVAEVGNSVSLLAEEANESDAARARALLSHCNRRLSRLLSHVGQGRRVRVKELLILLKGSVGDFRNIGDLAVYQASSVPSVSSFPSQKSKSSKSTHESEPPPPEKPKRGVRVKDIDFQKWGVTYSGSEGVSVLSFIMDVEEKADSCGLPHRELLRGAPEFFQGRAKTWYRSVKSEISSWEEMKNYLRAEYLPVGYVDNLWEEIRARLQGEAEPIGQYIANMLSLFSRLELMGTIEEEMKLGIIEKNLAPFYVKQLVNTKVMSIPHLKKLGRMIEEAKFRVERYDRTKKTPLMEPEFAYKGRARRTQLDEVGDVEPEVAALTDARGRRPFLCWRCGADGHSFRDCQARGNFPRFCWGCGKRDMVIQNCVPCQERKARRAAAAQPDAPARASETTNPSEGNQW